MFFVQEHFAKRIRDNVAIFSDPDPTEGRPLYRQFIGRTWDWKLPRLYVCMCNPSDAGAETEDPTSSRVNHFARRWGYGGWGGVNLADLISAHPSALDTHPTPVSDANALYHEHIFYQAKKHGTPILAAWGNNGSRGSRDRQFIQRAKHLGVPLICLGLTQHGHPKHPMARGEHRIPDDFDPIPFDPPWTGRVTIGEYTVPLHPDGTPVCGRCDGTGKSPSIVTIRAFGAHDTTDVCSKCGGSGCHPNPFGEPT